MRAAMLALAAVLAGCSGDKDDTDTGTPVGDDDDDDDTTPTTGAFDITGIGLDAATRLPLTEGLCADLLDPTPALGGAPPTVLQSTTIGADGSFTFTDISAKPALGMLVEIADCATKEPTRYNSATGIAASSYEALGEGDTLSDLVALSIDLALLDAMQDSAAALGYTGDLGAEGMLFGFALDATGQPVAGVTVTSGAPQCDTVFYLDGDPVMGGLFATDTGPNTETQVSGGAVFVIPAAPIQSYQATGGGQTYPAVTAGSNPGVATIVAFLPE